MPETNAEFLHALARGLAARPRTLPPKFFYDERGSELFEAICDLEEYYPTRTELSILETHSASIAAFIGEGARLVEVGSGASTKTEVLLRAVPALTEYVPIDISEEMLAKSAKRVAARFPQIPVCPVCADYSEPVELPPDPPDTAHRVVFFSGSTIGNFEPEAAVAFMTRLARLARPGGVLLIGVDLVKDRATLEAAYDDSQGVTAAFNLNVLHRANREAEADFDTDAYSHRAVWNAEEGRIEMHLVSGRDQTVHLAGEPFEFPAGETLCTEYSYKYTLEGFRELAGRAGFERRAVWTDPARLYSLQGFEAGTI